MLGFFAATPMVLLRNAIKLFVISAVLLGSTFAQAHDQLPEDSIKARYRSPSEAQLDDILVSPRRMPGGGLVTLVSPANFEPLAKGLEDAVDQTHQLFTRLFGQIPQLRVAIRLLPEDDFFKLTKAPRWTNALFYRGEITIPVAKSGELDGDTLQRAVTHEYAHALIHSLSKGNCPGWIDEGLAQWAEGSANPALQPVLLRWLSENPPVPLTLLQGGFTRLDSRMVPAAYAQSLYAVNFLISNFGFDSFRLFFSELNRGQSREMAFKKAFGLDLPDFEQRLHSSLNRWRSLHLARQSVRIQSPHSAKPPLRPPSAALTQ